VNEGLKFLDRSTVGAELTAYHMESAIAASHAIAPRADETDWERIIALYDTLMALNPSPIVALNRAIVVAQNEGPERGLQEINAIAGRACLATYPFYFAALGEFQLRSGRPDTAREHFRPAVALARNPMECRFLNDRVRACEVGEFDRDHTTH
jgi:RNA polymerase sigma-70 factor (ECF subfamily)